MDDYIKREDAQKITAEWLSGYINDDERNVIEHIDIDLGELPPADVVEVVRCKDCRKWITVLDREKASYGLCEGQPQGLATRSKNDFCSYGERADT